MSVKFGKQDLSIAHLRKPKSFTPIFPENQQPVTDENDQPLEFLIYSIKSPTVINAMLDYRRENDGKDLKNHQIVAICTEEIKGNLSFNGKKVTKDNIEEFYASIKDNDDVAWLYNQITAEVMVGDYSPKKSKT